MANRAALEMICRLCKRLNPANTGNPDTCNCDDTDFLRQPDYTDQDLMEKIQAIRDKTGNTISFGVEGYAFNVHGDELKYNYWNDHDRCITHFPTRNALMAHMVKILEG